MKKFFIYYKNFRFYGIQWTVSLLILKFLYTFHLPLKRSVLRIIHEKSLPHPLIIRKGTSDLLNYLQVYKSKELLPCLSLKGVQKIVDIGAYIGCTTTYFLSQFPNSEVVCVEPDPDNFELLSKNLSPYGNRAQLIQAAVWNNDSALHLKPHSQIRCKWGTRVVAVDSAKDLKNVQGRSMTTLMQHVGWRAIDLLKIDIEGSELELFHGDIEPWVHGIRNMLVEFHRTDESAQIIEKLKNYFPKHFHHGEHHYFLGNACGGRFS